MKTLNELKKEKKQMLVDCWMYHKNILKEYTTKTDLEDYLNDLTGRDWEDVMFIVGYISALDFIINSY